jgi:hypothetical protein
MATSFASARFSSDDDAAAAAAAVALTGDTGDAASPLTVFLPERDLEKSILLRGLVSPTAIVDAPG